MLILLLIASATGEYLPPSCDSPVYCYGDLLKTVQLAPTFNDSKTFVDMKMKYAQNDILENFNAFLKQTRGSPDRKQVQQFVKDNFVNEIELDEYVPTDFEANPRFANAISNETVKNFTLDVIKIWPTLARKVRPQVIQNKDRYSLIPVPNGFIIPGGRFREYYYWDSYWIISGLLISEMSETARGMIENFIYLVNTYGFVPNGGRLYYLKRSQPPLLTSMSHLYLKYTHNVDWLHTVIATLEKELQYWRNQSIVIKKHNKTYTLYRYNAVSAGPRPESYREDINTASYYSDARQQEQIYQELKSGAESGWDFSTRWIFDETGGNKANLSRIQTSRAIPVDLNAFLCKAFDELSQMYSLLGKQSKAAKWRTRHLKIMQALNEVLWDKTDGIWYDYDVELEAHRKYFYPSSVTPLWAKCFNLDKKQFLGKSVLRFLKRKDVLDYLGGVPTSDIHSGEQWDFPNAWPPLQDIVVKGLDNTDYKPAQEEAAILANRWINANMIGYANSGEMFEKYDATDPGAYGNGGEYVVQSGFGWTNGVVLDFINTYYAKINYENKN